MRDNTTFSSSQMSIESKHSMAWRENALIKTISINNLSDLLGVSRSTVEHWVSKGRIHVFTDGDGKRVSYLSDLTQFDEVSSMLETSWEVEMTTKPMSRYSSVELFAGAGGLAIGMERAGFEHIMLNEMDHSACKTLRTNRPNWHVVEGDIHGVDFSNYRDKVDLLTGGFPCQAFSYAGKRLGFEETRGTLFFELARALQEIRPRVLVAENVRGLLEHDGGKTLETIKNVISDLGYVLIEPHILRAIQYDVPQKRERLILVAIREDLWPTCRFEWPSVAPSIRTLRDAFMAGTLYPTDVPESLGQVYPKSKAEVMRLVPEGGDWRDLPDEVAKAYMKASYYLGGGKTGMARRLAMDEPSLTLTCAPAQKQTERCHPYEDRPLTVREYARIQTFPDEWKFCGSLSAQYRQIGNAVPVNMAWALGRSLVRMMNHWVEIGLMQPIDKSNDDDHACTETIVKRGTLCDTAV